MTKIPEEQHASALRRVADARQAVRASEEELRAASVDAARVGAPRTRIKALAEVSSRTLYKWLTDAGVQVRSRGSADE